MYYVQAIFTQMHWNGPWRDQDGTTTSEALLSYRARLDGTVSPKRVAYTSLGLHGMPLLVQTGLGCRRISLARFLSISSAFEMANSSGMNHEPLWRWAHMACLHLLLASCQGAHWRIFGSSCQARMTQLVERSNDDTTCEAYGIDYGSISHSHNARFQFVWGCTSPCFGPKVTFEHASRVKQIATCLCSAIGPLDLSPRGTNRPGWSTPRRSCSALPWACQGDQRLEHESWKIAPLSISLAHSQQPIQTTSPCL